MQKTTTTTTTGLSTIQEGDIIHGCYCSVDSDWPYMQAILPNYTQHIKTFLIQNKMKDTTDTQTDTHT